MLQVDPLDGTKEYTEGRKQDVTVLIGIAAHGKAVGGVIYQPFFEVDGTLYPCAFSYLSVPFRTFLYLFVPFCSLSYLFVY